MSDSSAGKKIFVAGDQDDYSPELEELVFSFVVLYLKSQSFQSISSTPQKQQSQQNQKHEDSGNNSLKRHSGKNDANTLDNGRKQNQPEKRFDSNAISALRIGRPAKALRLLNYLESADKFVKHFLRDFGDFSELLSEVSRGKLHMEDDPLLVIDSIIGDENEIQLDWTNEKINIEKNVKSSENVLHQSIVDHTKTLYWRDEDEGRNELAMEDEQDEENGEENGEDEDDDDGFEEPEHEKGVSQQAANIQFDVQQSTTLGKRKSLSDSDNNSDPNHVCPRLTVAENVSSDRHAALLLQSDRRILRSMVRSRDLSSSSSSSSTSVCSGISFADSARMNVLVKAEAIRESNQMQVSAPPDEAEF